MTEEQVPTLLCPGCKTDLIPATGRGRHDRDGNYIEHREGCRCAWCDWVWFDDADPVTCKCGIRVKIAIDDGYAYPEKIEGTI